SYSARGSTTSSSPLGVRIICGPLMASAPPVSGRGSAADVDRQNRGCILIEDHPVAANAEPVAVTALQRLHIAVAAHGIAVKPRFHSLATFSRKAIEILRGT